MAANPAGSLATFLLGLGVAPTDPASGNRFSIEGLAIVRGSDDALEIRIQRLEAASLHVASGPLRLEVGQLFLHGLVARIGIAQGRPGLRSVEAASAELSGVKVQGLENAIAAGTLTGGSAASWSLAPLATADGTIEAEIVDATLIFDADVKVPIRQGRVDFNEATVAHVGPDSRMGASRLGLYVDAPNGRSYLYQFPSAPVDGVEFEQRSALPGPWGTKRGSLRLQPFAEWLLRQAAGGQAPGITEQARLLLARTAVAGFLQLGDGKLAAPGVEADFVERAAGRNVVRLHSQAVGRGLDIDVAALSLRNAAWSAGATRAACASAAGAMVLKLTVDGAQWRVEMHLAKLTLSGLRLQLS